MATRSQKAAMKKKADAEKAQRAKVRAKREEELDVEAARAAEALEAEAAKDRKGGKKAKAAKAPKGKRGKGKEQPVEFADEGLIIDTPAPKKPGFMARWRASREEKAQAKAIEAERRAAEKAADDQRKAEERAAAEAQAAKEAEERRVAEEAAAAVAEKERRKEEARAARQAAKDEAARLEAEKEAAAEAKKEERRQQRLAERAAIEERERLAAEQVEADDRRREEEKAAKAAAAAARKAEAKELEPDLEFEEGSTPVDPARALVLARKEPEKGKKSKSTPAPATEADAQADRMAEELSRRRSKPVVILEEEAPTPKLPNLREVATGQKADDEDAPLVTGDAVVDERYKPDAPMPAPPSGLSIPEMFIVAVNEGGWDERIEKSKPGRLGGALSGAVVLELLVRGRVLVQRDRFTVVGEAGDDPAVEAAVNKLRSIRERKGDIAALAHMRRFAKWNREMLEPFKERLAGRGLVQHGHRMHLGVFYRSSVTLLDEDAQERLRNKLRRAIAGGGTPEASSILLLGLLDACGLLATIVPDEAMDYNRKRLNGLLGGRDIMGYKVDPQLKALQEVAVRTILQNVRTMTSG